MPRKPGEKYMEKRKKDRMRRYNDSRPTRHDFYHSTVWRKARGRYKRLHPLCEECERRGRVVPADVVHHKVEIALGGDPLSFDNLESLCHSCHNKIHGEGALKTPRGGG